MSQPKELRVLITDDEQPARSRLRMMLEELDAPISVIGEASDGKEAITLTRKEKPELIFLDIQMPVLDGFDVVELLGEECPPVIFVTAYDEYALKAFEVHAVDYLLKPVRKERLKESVMRMIQKSVPGNQSGNLKKLIASLEPSQKNLLQKIPVSYKREIRFINHEQILWFEADGKLTWVYTTDEKKFRCDFSLSDLEKRLSGTAFLRIHRSAIANLNYAIKMESWFKGGYRITLKGGTELDVARRRVDDLKARLGL